MDEEKKPTEEPEVIDENITEDVDSDALSTPPSEEELEKSATKNLDEIDDQVKEARKKEKRVSPIRNFLRQINVYLLLFILTLVVAGIVIFVAYLNSQKVPVKPDVATQELTAESLKELANKDTSVGSSSQTLTIKGNAVIDGQTLTRGDLNVANNIQAGNGITAPNITVATSANLGETQARSLQVQGNLTVQGETTLAGLNVSGASSFSGAVTAGQLTVSRLIMSGNAKLEVPNHISFTGPTPNRTINPAALGRGGSLSLNGSDTSGTISISSGTDTAAGCFAKITFNRPFDNFSRVIVSPVGSAAGKLSYYVDRDRTGFSLCTNNAAPVGQTFAFDYFVTN